MKKFFAGHKAQGMVEYILIIALIAIIAIAVVRTFGTKIQQMFTKSSDKIAQESNNIR